MSSTGGKIGESVDLFGREGQAALYAKYRPKYTPEIFDTAIDLLRQGGSEAGWSLAIDVACGTGQVTVPLARWFHRVIGVDQSLEQLRHAEQQADSSMGSVSYVAGSAYELLSLAAPESANLVTIGQAMHWLDFDRFFASAAAVLRPGGVLAVLGYGVLELEDPRLDAIFQRYYFGVLGSGLKPGEAGCFWDCDRSLVDTAFQVLEEKGFGPCFEPPGITDGGFTRKWYKESSRQSAGSLFGYLRSFSAYRTLMNREGAVDPLPALQEEMGLQDLTQEIGITFPYFLLTAKKQRE